MTAKRVRAGQGITESVEAPRLVSHAAASSGGISNQALQRQRQNLAGTPGQVTPSHTATHPQAKLEVGAADDPLEREADDVAAQLASTAEPGLPHAHAADTDR